MSHRILIKHTIDHIGKDVVIMGWVANRRDHGKVQFFDIRDRSGIVQTVAVGKNISVSIEDSVKISGHVKKRPDKLVNPKLHTGTIEIEVSSVEVLGKSKDIPFPLDTDGYEIKEEVRLKYRYLDLRRERLQKNLRLRSEFIQRARSFLFDQEFVEIETPLLTKSTPEGSRDFVVPSRLHPGSFYALPQSPQQYKQLLMVAGFERYFQIARCLRDEDLRADRGFEHTQIDLEMSFMDQSQVMDMLESLITTVYQQMGKTILQTPFPVYTYAQAMKEFGADKFDLRTEKQKEEGILAFAWVVDFPFFEKTDEGTWTFTHNPFSCPKPEYISDLLEKKNIGDIVTSQYDLVCNGLEVGGGSIRAHRSDLLHAVFEIMGYKEDQIQEQFGHMLEAFSYGAPPHGGCAFGVERQIMIMTGEQYLREVVAFPQTAGGHTSIMQAPSLLSPKQMKELGIMLSPTKK